MQYSLNDEQLVIQKAIRNIATQKVEPYASEIDKNEKFPDELREFLVSHGIMTMPFSTEYGGGGADTLTMCIVLEELAYACSNTAMIVGTNELGSMPLILGGTSEQKAKYLSQIASGKATCAFALTEHDAGSDVANMRTKAEDKGDKFIVNGTKQFISAADTADFMCLFARTDPGKGLEGISAFIVEKNSPGIQIGKKEEKMGFKGFAACEVIFEDVEVSKENLLGKRGEGFKLAMMTLDRTRPLVGAIAVGIAQSALDYAITYSKQRVQFGKPIASYQGLQFMMADMAMSVESARQLVYKAASMIDGKAKDISIFGAMAKCYGTDVAMKVTVDAVQILGGYGYMKDYPLERKMRDAKLLQIVEGTNQIQRIVISRELLTR